ncbi:hypothetical protein HK103_003461 [Boothiomyces macroporosus]|uniref:Uncharacterized protein n=1 Tax=Boothiomyces macroporosus TaxID=261099 RepID=A0AAD5Y945_9FUNG|nr:hypothetical protein HK103_003461 [Boothiomyces macroporosus]
MEEEKIQIEEKTTTVVEEISESKPKFGKRGRNALLIDLAIWIAMTAYFVAFVSLGSGKQGFGAGVVAYVFISLRLLARHVSVSQVVYKPLGSVASSAGGAAGRVVSEKYRAPVIGVVAFILIAATSLLSKTTADNSIGYRIQSLLGIVVILVAMTLLSHDRKNIPWYTVSTGLLIQYFIALIVLKTQWGFDLFNYISRFLANFLGFSHTGAVFIFGDFDNDNFAKSVFPAIVFFCSFIYIVYYWGGMQYIVAKMGWFFVRAMDTSGAESVVACASPFIGQGENALLVAPFVEFMTRSEIHSIMTSGFATIAGSVLIYYLTIVPNQSTILTCCIMSIPAGLLLSKMRYPETEESLSKGDVKVPESNHKDANFLHAASNGSAVGMQLVILIGGGLLAIISLYNCVDFVVGWLFAMINVFEYTTGKQQEISIAFLLSYVFAPVAWLVGMPGGEARLAGKLMATKMIINEFAAYKDLYDAIKAGTFSQRTVDLLSFALCGFANIGSIGIQIGALGAIAPSRSADFAELAVSAMLTGTVATWMTACVAGALM